MFKRLLIKLALRTLKGEVIDKIQYPAIQQFLQLAYSNLSASADIVTDDNPDNKAQFAALWNAQKKVLLLTGIDTTRAVIVEEVENVQTEKYLTLFLDELRAEVEAGNILKNVA